MQAILNISGKTPVSKEMLISLTSGNDKISRKFFNISIEIEFTSVLLLVNLEITSIHSDFVTGYKNIELQLDMIFAETDKPSLGGILLAKSAATVEKKLLKISAISPCELTILLSKIGDLISYLLFCFPDISLIKDQVFLILPNISS